MPMNRCAIRFRAWRISRQIQVVDTTLRSVSTASAGPINPNTGQKGLLKRLGGYNGEDGRISERIARYSHNAGQNPLWRYNHRYGKVSTPTQDIIVDDLSATLEAHRARNRTSVIRKQLHDVDTRDLPFERLILEHTRSDDVGAAYERLREKGDATDQSRHSTSRLSKPKASVKEIKHRKRSSTRRWPADTIQGSEEDAKAIKPGFVRSIDPLEYQGVVMPIKGQWKVLDINSNIVHTPWLPYVEYGGGDGHERLSNEIRAFEAYMRLSPAEEAAAQLVKSDAASIVDSILPTKPLTLLGSRCTGLATPTSDFDFSVDVGSSERASTVENERLTGRAIRRASTSVLRQIMEGLRKSRTVVATELVFARVPILKCRHRATGLDIQFQTMAPFQASQQYTAAYLSEFPSLRPLYVLIRHFLGIRDLTTVFFGGFGSYTILMMIVAALKHSGGKFVPNDLAGQLLHILDFYGNANLYEAGFSVDPPRTIDKTRNRKRSPEERKALDGDRQLQGIEYLIENSNARKPYLLCLQDPANEYNDLGRNAYSIKHVQVTFLRALNSIKKSLSRPQTHHKEIPSFLSPMVRADYTLFELDRRNIERCHNPAVKLSTRDANEGTIITLLERRLKVIKGELEEDDPPFTAAKNASEPDAMAKQAEWKWYPGTTMLTSNERSKRNKRHKIRGMTRATKKRTEDGGQKKRKKSRLDLVATEDDGEAGNGAEDDLLSRAR